MWTWIICSLPVVATIAFLVVKSVRYGLKLKAEEEFQQNELLKGLKPWLKERLPIQFEYIDLTPAVGDYFRRAAQFWNTVVGAPVFGVGGRYMFVIGQPTQEGFNKAMEEANVDEPHGLAFASIYYDHDTKQISDATVTVNETKFFEHDEAGRERIAAHELGHVLGLAHDNVRNSVMYSQLAPGRATVTAADRAWLKRAYK